MSGGLGTETFFQLFIYQGHLNKIVYENQISLFLHLSVQMVMELLIVSSSPLFALKM